MHLRLRQWMPSGLNGLPNKQMISYSFELPCFRKNVLINWLPSKSLQLLVNRRFSSHRQTEKLTLISLLFLGNYLSPPTFELNFVRMVDFSDTMRKPFIKNTGIYSYRSFGKFLNSKNSFLVNLELGKIDSVVLRFSGRGRQKAAMCFSEFQQLVFGKNLLTDVYVNSYGILKFVKYLSRWIQ